MKIAIVLGIIALIGIGGAVYLLLTPDAPAQYIGNTEDEELEPQSVIAENLEYPWEIVFLPDGELLVTERPGTVLLLQSGVEIEIEGVVHTGEGGLLGAALHPNFSENAYVYLYQTTETDAGLENRVVRYILEDETLTFDRLIIDNIPGARYHDGGRIKFGPDGYLYVTVGDAGNEASAQDPQNLGGSILRVTDEGAVPEDNPFGNAVYSYGHRNPQGIAWDNEGRLWSTEHGRSGVRSGFDEINLIAMGENYGWPESEGDAIQANTVEPIMHSSATTTWAPSGAAYVDGSLYFAGLRGETLYEAVLEGERVVALNEHLVGEYGRLRTVTVGPDSMLYISTSNGSNDKIIRIDPRAL